METPLNTMWQEAVRPKKGANGPKAIDLNEKSGAPGLEAIDLTEKCAAIGLEAIDLNEKSGTTGPKAIDRTEEGGSIGLKSIDSTEKGSAIGLEAIDPHTQTDSDNELLEIINDLLEIDDSYTKLPKVDIATAINEIDRANKVATILVQLVAKSKENPCGEGIGSTIDVQDRNGDMIRCSLYDTGYRKYHADLQVSSKTTEKFTVDFEI